MMEEIAIRCPFCGEVVTLGIAWEDVGRVVDECPVCRRPIELEVRRDEWGDPIVTTERTSGD